LKTANCNLPHLYLASLFGVIPSEFRGDFWHQKARVTGLSYDVVCVILDLALFVEFRLVTDRQTNDDCICRTSI